MMNRSGYLPKTVDAFRDWVIHFFAVLSKIYRSLGISDDMYGAFVASKNVWDAADAIAEDPRLNTDTAKRNRRHVMTEFSISIRAFNAKYLFHNHLLTLQQQKELGLLPANPSPSQPKPVTIPRVEITAETPAKVDVHCFEDEAGWDLPENAYSYEWGWVVSDTPPESYSDLNSEFSTRARYSRRFDYSQRGKKLQSVFRWENEQGETGPWTEFYETVIP
jgi:hypothetical protein